MGQRRQYDILYCRARSTDRNERARERVRSVDLVISIGADQQQVPDIRLRQEIFEQIERGGIEPLQVVEEERQRMLRARKDANEPPQHRLKAALRILRWQIGDRRLFADNEFKLGYEVHDQEPVRAQCLAKGIPPTLQLSLGLAQDLPDQT